MSKSTKRSIGAVVAGLLVIIVVTTLVDILLHLAGVFPPLEVPIDDRLSAIATSYRIVIRYPIALTVLAVPQCWAGGWLREKQLRLR